MIQSRIRRRYGSGLLKRGLILVGPVLLLTFGWRSARRWGETARVFERNAKGLALAAKVANLGMWEWDISRDKLRMTAKGYDLFQFPRGGTLTFKEYSSRVHPEDREMVEKALRTAMRSSRPFEIAYRLTLPDRTQRWITASGLFGFNSFGKPSRLLCVCMDISERRNAEKTASELSRKLIHAQEDERSRIARELHDDLNQRLALLSVEMDLLGQSPPGMNGEFDRRLEHAAAQIRELSSEVHKLSYGLHPAKLEQLGLVSAVRSLCREFSDQHAVRIQFTHDRVPRDIPVEIALGVFRIIQEALRNVIRHSHAREAKVHLECSGGQLRLRIVDSGDGFDVESARRNSGLGLVSMEERVKLIHGTFLLRSRPGGGTQVFVEAPLPKNIGTPEKPAATASQPLRIY